MSYIVECIMHMPCASQSGLFSYYVHVYYLHGISQSPSLWWTMFILPQCTMHMYKLCTVFIIYCVSYTVFIIHCVCVCVCVCDTRHCVQLLTTQGPGSTTARVSPLSPRWKSYFATSLNILHSLATAAQPNANTQIQQILKCSMAKKPNSWWHRSPSGKYSITGVVTWLNIYFQKFKRCGWWSFELYLYTTNWK